MSDGHTDARRGSFPIQVVVKDANNQPLSLNDRVWFADANGELFEANIIEIYDNQIEIMTASNNLFTVDFRPKKTGTPICNRLLRK